jgi:hypothetical protein
LANFLFVLLLNVDRRDKILRKHGKVPFVANHDEQGDELSGLLGRHRLDFTQLIEGTPHKVGGRPCDSLRALFSKNPGHGARAGQQLL